jgi:tetrahydromethanopterin S-methyltransferase subunit A
MDHVDGQPLHAVWTNLADNDKETIGAQLCDFLSQLRRLKCSFIGSF